MSRRAIHNFLSALPSRIVGGCGQLASIGASLWPDRIKQWLGDNVTPEHIRMVAIPCVAIFAVYWLLWWWLKPRKSGSDSGGQTTSGQHAPVIGVINGAVSFGLPSSEPDPVPIAARNSRRWSDGQLKREMVSYIQRLHAFEEQTFGDDDRDWFYARGTEEEKQALWERSRRADDERRLVRKQRFNEEFRSDGRALVEEAHRRLGIVWKRHEDHDLAPLDDGALAGVGPVGDLADHIAKLARKLRD